MEVMREAVAVEVELYIDDNKRCPFTVWHENLDPAAVDLVRDAIAKRRRGIIGHSKHVGGGVHELKSNKYRIYYGMDGARLIVLLGGGTKKRQSDDIKIAREHWLNFKIRKKSEQGE